METNTSSSLPAVPPPQTPAETPKNNKHIAVWCSIVILVLLVCLGLWYSQNKGVSGPKEKDVWNPSAPAKETSTASVTYRTPTALVLPIIPNLNVEQTQIIYTVGSLHQAPYSGWDLLLYQHNEEGMKGSGYTGYLRLAAKEKELVLLPKISEKMNDYILGDVYKNLEAHGYHVTIDNGFTIPELEIPTLIYGETPNQTLTYRDATLTPADQITIDGTSSYAVQSLTLDERNAPTFLMGGKYSLDNIYPPLPFFVQQKDSLKLSYVYRPDSHERITFGPPNSASPDTVYMNDTDGCVGDRSNSAAVVPPSFFASDDLIRVGYSSRRSNENADVFTLRSDHPYWDNVYSLYKKAYDMRKKVTEGNMDSTWVQEYEKNGLLTLKTKKELVAMNAVIFIKNPFGLFDVKFAQEISTMCLAEPVVYLYPERSTQVRVALGGATPAASYPVLDHNAWNITATPAGKLTTHEGNTYSHLFWEAGTSAFSIGEKGFVVKQADVPSFFDTKLAFLGLNQKETSDFKKAWLPRFASAPYYFITFYQQDLIDAIAPLVITPKPDTITRILMDYKPLEKSITTSEPTLEKAPERKGFSVIEWGGIER